MDFAGITVPPINQNRISSPGLDFAGVLDSLPWKLGESLALKESSAFFGSEPVLLRVGGVPDPVHKEVGDEEGDHNIGTPVVGGWSVVSEVDGAVAIAQWNTGQVPEDEHESPFLVIHIPARSQPMKSHIQKLSYQVVVMHSSPFEQALAYKKWAITKKQTSEETYPNCSY